MGKSGAAVALIEDYRKKGVEVTADQYPYIASSTSLRATVVPSRYREGSQKDFVARLDDPRIGPSIRADIVKALGGRDGGKRIQIARYSPNPKWNGKNIAAIAEAEKKEPVEIVLEIERNGGAQIVNFGMSEEDVRVYMKQPWVATASDGGVQTPGATVPHPRNYGTFPRKIGYYAIQEKIVPLEAAIRSATGLPADILKLTDRGYVKPGYFADLVVFDPDDLPRHRDLREAAPVRRRREVGAGQRLRRSERRQVSGRRTRRPRAALEEVRREGPNIKGRIILRPVSLENGIAWKGRWRAETSTTLDSGTTSPVRKCLTPPESAQAPIPILLPRLLVWSSAANEETHGPRSLFRGPSRGSACDRPCDWPAAPSRQQ